MGASNRIQDLDPALLRPGRFDRQLLVSPPDLAGREAILEVHTRGQAARPRRRPRVVARQTAGLTGADLANICNEAAIFAGRRNLDRIGQADFEAALERVVAGLQQRRVVSARRRSASSPTTRRGHALMSYLMGDALPVQKVTIVSRGQALGYTLNMPMEERYLHTKEELVDMMKVVPRRSGCRAGRLRPRHERRRERPREGDRPRARDGLRVRHGRRASPRGRCGPTTTRSPRRRSVCATPSRPG